MQTATHAPSLAVIELAASDLTPQGTVACPSPHVHMPAWASHPRIYLHPDTNRQAQCPYCGTIYRLAATPHP